ncbi:granulocyte colony-stimulating factor-like isoform X2 [Brachionichthys hirsutus]|uniref:granulocyte colony-stimulating factor-like isoform X2 n=1 Tax=Brachionichthys hirsutus TaxID=412623 RepID=UPI0036043F62
MNARTVFTLHAFILLHYFLIVVQSAPVNPPPPFREAAESAKMLVEKILEDIVIVHAATVHTEGLTLKPSAPAATLQTMAASLGVPAAPVLKPLSEHFTLDACLSRMLAGSRLYQGLMGVLSGRLGGLGDLQADLRDLQTSIDKIKQLAQTDGGGAADDGPYSGLDLASHLHGNYEVQVAAHLALVQLRSFCHDLVRGLRAIATYRPGAVGAR